MAQDLTELHFSLHDVIEGVPLSPQTVDLPTLREFLAEIEGLIRGNENRASLEESRVRLEEGSIKVIAFIAVNLAASFQEDMAKLEQTGNLDSISKSRANIVEEWQHKALKSNHRRYTFGASNGLFLDISRSSNFQHGENGLWVSVEKYLNGKATNIGGKREPNIHLELAGSNRGIKVSSTEKLLADERENQLYKDVTLHVRAEQNIRTHELRNYELIAFVSPPKPLDSEVLTKLWRNGQLAWSEVRSSADWVDQLRGNS